MRHPHPSSIRAALPIVLALAAGHGLSQPVQERGTPLAGPPSADRPSGRESASRYQTGMALLNRGLNDAAERELRAFLDEAPNSKDATNARYALGIALTRQGKFADAMRELEQVSSASAFRFAPDATLLLAQCLVRMGEDAKAEQALAHLPVQANDFERLDEATALRGECLQRLGKHTETIAALSNFSVRWPESKAAPRAVLVLAMSEAALDRQADAAEHAESLLERKDTGELMPRAAMVAARAREALGDRAKARTAYESAAASADHVVAADALLAAARLARADGDAQAAMRALDRLDSLAAADRSDPARDPASSPRLSRWAAYERARLTLDAGDAKDALTLLDPLAAWPGRLPRDDSPGTSGHADDATLRELATYWAARCEVSLGKFQDAAARLEALRRAIPQGQLGAESLFDQASALARAGEVARAAELCRQFLREYPAHAWAGEAALLLANSLVSIGDFANAAVACEQALAGSPRAPLRAPLLLVLGESRFAAKDYSGASDAYSKYLTSSPDGPDAWRPRVRLGQCALRMGRADGCEILQAALRTPADSPSGGQNPLTAGDRAVRMAALAELADSYAAAEQWAESSAAYARLVALGADAPDPQDLLRLGVSLRLDGHPSESLAPLGKAANDARAGRPVRDAARLELARAQMALNDVPAACSALAPLVEAGGPPADDADRDRRVTALRLLASIENSRGRTSEAAAYLTAAGKLGGDDAPDLLLDRGIALMNAGDFVHAEEALGLFLDRHTADPRHDEAKARLAIALARQGRHDRALALLASLNVEALPATLRDATSYEHAMSMAATGKAEPARVMLESLASSAADPGIKAAAVLEVARERLDSGNATEALSWLDERMASTRGADDDLSSRLVYCRASALMRLDRAREAAALLRQEAGSLAASDIAAAAALLTADALARSGQSDQALVTLGSLLESKPEASIRAPALLLRGDVAASAQQWGESELAYQSFLSDFGAHELWFRARFGLGRALEAQGKHLAAIEAYRDVVARHAGGTAARAQFQIGECLIALGKHQDAIPELMKVDAAYAEPEWSAAALFEVGRVLIMLKRPDDAARQFDEVVSRFPDSQWASMARKERTRLAPAELPGRRNAAAVPTATPAGEQ